MMLVLCPSELGLEVLTVWKIRYNYVFTNTQVSWVFCLIKKSKCWKEFLFPLIGKQQVEANPNLPGCHKSHIAYGMLYIYIYIYTSWQMNLHYFQSSIFWTLEFQSYRSTHTNTHTCVIHAVCHQYWIPFWNTPVFVCVCCWCCQFLHDSGVHQLEFTQGLLNKCAHVYRHIKLLI